MAKKQKYYVVWQGKHPGIYTDWDECKAQVQGVQGAQYKSFDTQAEAEAAIKLPYSSFVTSSTSSTSLTSPTNKTSKDILFIDDEGLTAIRPDADPANVPVLDALAVDAACSGNPGVMEYQGIYIPTRTRVFHYKAPKGTNNIGEFLAIVHALALMEKQGITDHVIYSDSVNAQIWVNKQQCKTKLERTPATEKTLELVQRAETWLRTHTFRVPSIKWDTKEWGEIPADFGRKK